MCSPGRGNAGCCTVMLYVGERSNKEQWRLLHSLLVFSHTLSYPQSNWALLMLLPECVCMCVHSRTLWVSPRYSPVRLGVSPTAASTPTNVFNQRFWGFISLQWNPGLCGLSQSPLVLPGLSAHKCGTAQSVSHHLAKSPLNPAAHLCPSYQAGWRFLL